MDDQVKRYRIEVDTAAAERAVTRLSGAFDQIGARAEAAANRATSAYSSMTVSALNHARAVDQISAAHVRLHAVLTRTIELAGSALALAGAAAQSGVSVAGAENAYRVTRIALSPTPFTAASLVAGALAQYSIVQASRQGNFITQQSMVAARANFGRNLSFDDAQRLSMAATFGGQATNTYQSMYADLRASIGSGSATSKSSLNTIGFTGTTTPTVDDLQNIGKALNAIVDPAQRARVALALFPTTASEAMRTLGRDFDYTNNAVDRFNTLLSEDAVANISKFKDNIEDLKGGFRELGQFVGAIEQRINGFFANIGAYIGNAAIGVAKAPVGVLGDLDFLITGKEHADTKLAMAQAPGFIRLQNNIVNANSAAAISDAQAAILAPDAARIAKQIQSSDDYRDLRHAAADDRLTKAYAAYETSRLTTGKIDPVAARELVDAKREFNTFPAQNKELDSAETAADDFRRRSVEEELTGIARVSATRDEMMQKYGKSPAARADIQAGIDALMRRARFQEAQEWSGLTSEENSGYAERSLNFSRVVGGMNIAQGSYGLDTIELQRQLGITQNAFGIDQAGYARDAALRNLALHPVGDSEDAMAQAAIQRTYLLQTSQIKGTALNAAQQKDLDDLDAALKSSQITQGNYDSRKGYILGNYGEQQRELAAGTQAGIADINGQAALALANKSRDEIQKDFETVKDSASQVFDALFQKGTNVFQALGNVLKNSVLNALKDAFTNEIAGTITNAMHPGSVSFEKSNGGGGLLGLLGYPNSPKFTPGNVPVAGIGGDPGVAAARDSQDFYGGGGSSGGALAGVLGFPTGIFNMLGAMNSSAAIGGTAAAGGGYATGGGSGSGLGEFFPPLYTAASGFSGVGFGSGSGSGGMVIDGSTGGLSTAGDSGVVAARDAVFGSTVSSMAHEQGHSFGLSSGGGSKNGLLSRVSNLKNMFYNQGDFTIDGVNLTNAASVSQAAGGGVLGSTAGGAAGFVASPAAGSLGLSLGLSGLEAKRQNLGTSAKTVGGFGLAGASIGASTGFGMAGGALVGVGVGLTADGIKRGGFAGLGEDAAGGAAVGFEFGGPFGAAIGAAAGLVAGAFRFLVTTDVQHAENLAQSLYHLHISQQVAQQIVTIAKQSYGGQIDIAMRAKPVLDLLTLYAQATGQKFGVQNVERPYFLTDSTKGVQQQAFYVDGSAYSYTGQLGVYGGVATTQLNPYIIGTGTAKLPGQGNYAQTVTQAPQSFQLDPDSTQAFLSGQAVQFVNGNPRVITDANQDAQSGGYGRLSSAALMLSPTLLT